MTEITIIMHCGYIPRKLGIEIVLRILKICVNHEIAQTQDRDLQIARAECVNFMSALPSSWLPLLALVVVFGGMTVRLA